MQIHFPQQFRQLLAGLSMTAILFSTLAVGANAQMSAKPKSETKSTVTKAKKLTEDQKIIHVLNRLAFGARPGDIEKVKAMGLDKYIEQQLNPAAIDDAATEARLQNFDVLKMSNQELFAKYPQPGAILQYVAQQNGLDKNEAKAVKAGKKEEKREAILGKETAKTDGTMEKPADGEMMNADKPKPIQPANQIQISDEDRDKYKMQVAELYKKYDLGRPNQISQELNASRIIRAVYSEKQLQEQMVDFWSNHFNVYVNKASVRWFLPEYDRDVIRPNALGNFKDLLLATAKSPAMLYYLDNFQSVAANQNQANPRNQQLLQLMQNGQLPPLVRERIKQNQGLTDEQLDQRIKQLQNAAKAGKGRGINENYAREIMELHTLSVNGGYTQKDIQEVARCFTGWTIVDPRGYRKSVAKMISGEEDKRGARIAKAMGLPDNAESGTFYFNAKAHDTGEKIVLGQKINEGGIKDGEKVIDILVNSPQTAKFIATKLAVKFVNDNPSEAFVSRIAAAFQSSHGDIKLTLRAIFTDKEFYAPENYRAKIKTPFEVTVSAIRVIGAETNGGAIQGMLGKMGEPLYGYIAPTGYPDMAEDWVNTGALLERMNFGVALASNRIPGTKADLAKFLNGRDPDNKDAVMNKFLDVILHGEVNPNTKATLAKQLNQPLPEPTPAQTKTDDGAMEMTAMTKGEKIGGGRKQGGVPARLLPASGNAEVYKIVSLILGSPDFQRQ